MVRGTATALGIKSMARDYGHVVKVALETGPGMSQRLGAGMVRHVETQWLWVQGVLHRRAALIPKTPVTSSRTAHKRDLETSRTGKSYPFSVSVCSTFRWTGHEAERTKL